MRDNKRFDNVRECDGQNCWKESKNVGGRVFNAFNNVFTSVAHHPVLVDSGQRFEAAVRLEAITAVFASLKWRSTLNLMGSESLLTDSHARKKVPFSTSEILHQKAKKQLSAAKKVEINSMCRYHYVWAANEAPSRRNQAEWKHGVHVRSVKLESFQIWPRDFPKTHLDCKKKTSLYVSGNAYTSDLRHSMNGAYLPRD